MLAWSLLIVLVILVVAALPTWPYSTSWGYYPSAAMCLVLFIILLMFLIGVLHVDPAPAQTNPAGIPH